MRSFLLLLILLNGLINSYSIYGQTYHVKQIPEGTLAINGLGNEKAWNKAEILNKFVYPWENIPAPVTSFSALHDNKWLYFRYVAEDDSVLVYTKSNRKLETGASDRVEIFFNINDSMKPYYCLELDANGRILDYTAEYYRKMHYEWHWPAGELIVKSSRTKNGYVMEGAISLQSLKDLSLLNGNRLHAGLFRAECKGFINNRPDLHWISWINPGTAQPDFHTASAFGTLLLE